MRESLLIVAVIVALLAVTALEPMAGIRYGLLVSLVGLAAGVLAAVVYHWQLHRYLAPRDVLPRRWWINAASFHRHLRPDERRSTMPAFSVGVACFVICMLGCAAMLSGLVRIAL